MNIYLDAIQARADAATEGPWETMRAGLLGTRVVHVDGEWEGIVPAEFITMVTPALKKADDALFMAHARTDVPELLALVRDLEARLGRVEAVHEPKSWTKYGIPCFDEFDSPTARINGCTCGNEHYPCPTIAALTATDAA